MRKVYGAVDQRDADLTQSCTRVVVGQAGLPEDKAAPRTVDQWGSFSIRRGDFHDE
jgi:hypothetical protein